MTHDEARQYFKDKGLTYDVLKPYTIDLLINIIQNEIMAMRKQDKDCILLRIKPHKYTAKQLKTNNYENLGLLVDGTYFSSREAVTFNSDGFIGFCGWASGYNNKPFIDGFIKWCDDLTNNG